MPMRPRVGIYDFLNSKPIINPILHGLVETPFELIIDSPSRLADRFSSGELDIAMIPSVEYARIEEAVIIPQICIASLGRVDTVLLFSKIGGYGGSSTRTEIAAGIIAICANGPVHVASDSKAFVKKTFSLINAIRFFNCIIMLF